MINPNNMELKGNQISAVAFKVHKELKALYDEKAKKNTDRINKFIESKVNLKSNAVLKEYNAYMGTGNRYGSYIGEFIKSKYSKEYENLNIVPVKPIPSIEEIRNEIIISTVDMKDVQAIIDHVKKLFNV